MNQVSQAKLQELAKYSGLPCISLYLPTEVAGAETRKNSIKFKNILAEAENKLNQLGLNNNIAEILAVARSYIDRHDFWQNQNTGLAFLIGQQGIEYFCLEANFSELAIVGDRFYLQPLLSIVNDNSQFYLLALAQNQIKLFLGNRDRLNEVELPENVPSSLAEALKYDDPEKQTQYHSGEPGNSPIYHGQGVGTTDNKDEIRRFFQQIANDIESAFDVENIPLVLAGVEYLLPIYKEVNSYQHLTGESIIGNPEHISPEELHDLARSIIKDKLTAEIKAAIDDYHNLSATDRTSQNLVDIVAAAAKGQIDTLFLVGNRQQWGNLNLQDYKVELTDNPDRDSLELYNFAAVNTYLQDGKVYFLDSDIMPEKTSIMATLRYPIYTEAEKVIA